MPSLNVISEDLKAFAETIKSILGTEVLIVDDTYVRLVSTESEGQYAKIDAHSVFAMSLQENKPYIIDAPRQDEACLACSDRKSCKEYGLVCSPISIDGRAVGVIGLIALSPFQRETLLDRKTSLLQFLDHIAGLIASKLADYDKSLHLQTMAEELAFIFDTLDKPMLTCDDAGQLISVNRAAMRYLRGTDLQQNAVDQLMSQVTKGEMKRKGSNAYHLSTPSVLLVGTFVHTQVKRGQGSHHVFVLEDSKTILGMYRAMTEGQSKVDFTDLVGRAPLFLEAVERAKRGAMTHLSILLLGESGTGKELFARAIHEASPRHRNPFIAINCAAIPEQLLEAELFGYEEGAFTGAVKGGRLGKFELADGGTLFLDEIGDMPLSLQAKLLRVLQDGYVTRVGAHFGRHVDVRILCATHQDLGEKLKNGTFRKDLFYRISAFPLPIPPLRERPGDIPILASYLTELYCERQHRPKVSITAEAMVCLQKHQWEGNVRELENAMAYALTYDDLTTITVSHLPMTLQKCCTEGENTITIERAASKDALLREAVARYGTSAEGLKHIQAFLGISRATLYRRLKRL